MSLKLIESIDDGISLVAKEDGTRQFLCHGILGEDASRQFEEEGTVNLDNTGGQEMFRFFDTKSEAIAYWQGLNDAEGWFGFAATKFDQHMAVFQE